MTTKELKALNDDEKLAFSLIQKGEYEKIEKMIKQNKVRVNCLDSEGMNLLDQACFKGDERLVEFLIEHGADVDNRAHSQGYTCLMFAALSGKPTICQRLLDAGARSYAVNVLGKNASEMAAFVGQHECVSVISSYIDFQDVEKIVHPNGAESSEQFPSEMVEFIHRLTRTNAIHPVRLAFSVMDDKILLKHCKKIVNTVDALFEKQLRTKEPNEIQSMKLWLILFLLRELLKFIDLRLQSVKNVGGEADDDAVSKAIRTFAKNLVQASPDDFVRPTEERFLRSAVCAFPYKQSIVYQTLSKTLNEIKFGDAPAAYLVICQALFGFRFVQTANFCSTCGVPSAQKRCKACKSPYCSVECQRFDWPVHKNRCEELGARQREETNAVDRTHKSLPNCDVKTD